MRILISGAGMAGLTAALTLGRTGHEVAVVERASHLRSGGSPIDVRGEALDVAADLGVLEHIRANQVTMSAGSQFIDRHGEAIADLPAGEVQDSSDDVEITRDALGRILFESLPASATVRFGDSIRTLRDHDGGVDVTFESGVHERFDAVVGADGMHSLTRRLVFGPEEDYLHHLGLYTALTTLDAGREPGAGQRPTTEQGLRRAGDDATSAFLNWPGHLIGIARYGDISVGVMTFRSPWIPYDHHDLDAQRRIVLREYADHDEWRISEIMDAVRADPDLYVDSVSQIHMPAWHRGRIVLIGDAAHCASGLSGRGTSLAFTGARILADELQAGRHPVLSRAFDAYEERHRPGVTWAQQTAGPGGDLVVPATQADLDRRNERLRAASAEA